MGISKFLPSATHLDPVQADLVASLEEIAARLNTPKFFFSFWKKKITPQGIYLYGGVGRGKTMLMRAFYELLTVKKQLVHYQNFMQSVHLNVHKLQGQATSKIISKLAREYATITSVICMDEFEIKDITDAMIIGRLFQELLKLNVFIFVTSNTEPVNLYKDGLQRESFLPFIDMINQNFAVLPLNNNHDYRLDKISNINNRVIYPLNSDTRSAAKKIITEITGNNLFPSSIEVFGRKILFEKTHTTTLVSNFEELFMQDMGYADYVSICQHFKVIILENVPVLSEDNTDIATRFINFIDNAYFHKVLLFITLASEPALLYQKGKRSEEFARTVSRLYEMNSNSYLEMIYEEF